MINLNPTDWDSIARRVTNKALPIFEIPFNTRLKSEIISSLFEIETASYYKENGYNIKNASNYSEPDIFFIDSNTPLEIKVTKDKSSIKWMGNKISKKESQFVLIVLNEVESNLFSTDKGLKFYITTVYLTPEDWSGKDDGYSYHASFLPFSVVQSKEKTNLVGNEKKLCEYLKCNCYNCADTKTRMSTMILCPKCGNKRCPKATDHHNECTNSNDVGQEGSRY